MTNEEAIEVLAQDLPCETDEDLSEAMTMAIKALEQQPCEDWYDVPSNEMTLEQARQAVKDLRKKLAEYLEQKPCEDCISRQAVLDAINTYDKFGYTETGCFVREPKGDYVPYIHYDDVIKCIKNVSPVTPKEKTGKWIKIQSGDDMFPEIIVCSKCNNENSHLDFNEHAEPIGKVFIKSKFCPNCGARMVS